MQPHHLEDLRGLLTRVRRRWVTATSMRAAAQATVVCLGLLLLVLAADRFLQPDDGPMAVVAAVALLAALICAVRVAWPLRRFPSDTRVARFIEERCPDLEDRLASATEVAARGPASPLGSLVLGDAAQRARRVDLDRVVARGQVRRSLLRTAVVTVAFLGVLAAGLEPVTRIVRTAWLYAFPYSATLAISPGSTRVVAGTPLRVEARIEGTLGAPSRTLPVVTLTDLSGTVQTLPMRPSGTGFEAVVPAVEGDFTYHVTAATLTSEDYTVAAVFAPNVERVDVAYQYPSFANLEPRVEADGGDIYAPVGTMVTVTVHLDKPVVEGQLTMAGGGRFELHPTSPRALETTFEVRGDDTYRVAAVDADSLSSAADIDYFVRTVTDGPPDIELVRPTADREITPLEEVEIEARADDDFGLERFELVYAVVGRSEHAINLLGQPRSRRARGAHTVYGETLDITPGDFISYYVRALDTNTGSGAGEVRSDIYFLEVRPFDQEFEEAQSQATAAMDAGAVEDLAGIQKEIIVATWRLDRQDAEDRASEDLATVADAQEELKWATQRAAERILGRGRANAPGGRTGPSAETQAMRDAIDAMEEAQAHLREARTAQAVPPEMDALNQLLKAQAEIRRKQVATQRSNGGGQRGGNQAREDLSALFDEDLRRNQETNYEDRATAGESTEEESETARRLRELAERQDALAREQESLADQAAELTAEELRRRLERLTREQDDVRRALENLPRSSATSRDDESADRVNEIAEQMRRAMGDMRRGDLSQAAERSQEASARLQELQRGADGSPSGGAGQARGELQLEAQRLADLQRQLGADARRSAVSSEGRETREELSNLGERLADRVESLEDRLDRVAARASDEAGEDLVAAADELRGRGVARQNRQLADRLREMADDAEVSSELAGVADTSDDLADVLEGVAGWLANGDPQRDATRRLAAELERAQELRQALEQIERQLAQMTALAEDETRDQSQPADGSVPGQQRGGPPGAGELAELQQQFMRQLAETPELLERLQRGRPTAEQDLERWAQHWQNGPAPGTEAFKQDLSAWQSLQRDIQVALEEYEEARTRALREEETADRLNVGPGEQLPEAYRRLVADYYRSIARQSSRP